MPYQMTHLYIAHKVAAASPCIIHDLPQYYLGSLAPDAVHFRYGYEASMKKVSHLCVGDERWGEITDDDAWRDSILAYWSAHREAEDADLLRGLCGHCLADMRNNIELWSPLKDRLHSTADGCDLGGGDLAGIRQHYYEDVRHADAMLCHTLPCRDEIWDALSRSEGIDVGGLVHRAEMECIRDHILYKQYAGQGADTAYEAKLISFDDYLCFLDNTASFIVGALD